MNVEQQDWIGKWAVYSPNKTAIRSYETNEFVNYYDLNLKANRIVGFCRDEYELKKSDRILVLSEFSIELIALFSAAQKAGFTLVPINYRLTMSEIKFLIENAQPSIVIIEDKFDHLINESLLVKMNINLLKVQTLIDVCNIGIENDFDKLSDSYFIEPLEEEDAIFILYTSGTTGFPKGAIYTHKMLFWNSVNTAMSLIINSESRTINCMPPFHTGGWNVLLTPFLHHGGYTTLLQKFEPEIVLDLLENEDSTIFMAVPTMLKMIADLDGFDQAKLDSLLYLIVGGEPMPINLIEIWHEKNVPVRQGYGMTEVGPNLTSLHQDDAVSKKGSIGRTNFYVKARIVDELGVDVTNNTPGELVLQGPMVTPGYWNNEKATNKAIKKGWFHTGDMAKEDEDGCLYIVDRIKNMYISGGENVYPAEVERIIRSMNQVSNVSVIGIPDEKWGESGYAFIVLEKDISLSKDEITDYCKVHLAKFKVPKKIQFIIELPKNDSGKIDKNALKQII